MIKEDPDDANVSFFEQELLPEINTKEDILGFLQWDEGNNLIWEKLNKQINSQSSV